MESPRWSIITPSQYEWERCGLDFIRKGLPDHDPPIYHLAIQKHLLDTATYE